MSADPDLRLGTLFQLEAQRAGHGREWRSYLAGRLLVPAEAISFRLLGETVPKDRAGAAAIAARHGGDPELLWLAIRSARTELMSGTDGPS